MENQLEKWKRKDLKRNAKTTLLRNFLACFVVCLVLTSLTSGPSSITRTIRDSEENLNTINTFLPNTWVGKLSGTMVEGLKYVREATKMGDYSSTGAIHGLYQMVSESGGAINVINKFLSTLMNENVNVAIAAGISIVVMLLILIFLSGVINVGVSRFFLENRLYPETKVTDILYIYRVKKTIHVAIIVFLKLFFHALWSLTIVGFFIKRYSYYLVPYIVAENPEIPKKDVLKLSARMMHGHKWRTFILEMSFLLWRILSLFTFGILEYLYVNPYINSTKAELYTELRARAIAQELEKVEYLDDKYLFELPDSTVSEGYEEGVYPVLLRRQTTVTRMREWLKLTPKPSYSVVNLIFMFFIFAFIGWVWECAYEYYKLGIFVNRGTMYGPWIPIYGFGGLLMIVLLNRFASKPLVAFFSGIVIAGVMEYLTATVIWYTKGLKYWDYSNYFLNIQGRICLEGLLFFGIMGLMGIYIFAPLADNLLEKIPVKVKWPIAIALIVLFTSDRVIATIHPREGEGITYDE